MQQNKQHREAATSAGQYANQDRRRKYGETFLNLVRRHSSARVGDAIDALVLPGEDKGCDPGELGAWVFELVDRAARDCKILPPRIIKFDRKKAFMKMGLSEAEAAIAAEIKIKPASPSVTANELRKCAQRFHKFADKIGQFNEKLDPLEREWMNERLPDHLARAGTIYKMPLMVHLYAQSLEDLSDELPKPRRGRRGMQIFSIEMELCALMSYVIEQTGKQAKPPFWAVAAVLCAAYRDPAVAGPKAKIPPIFKSGTFQIYYRRRHPRRKHQNVKSSLR